MTARPDEQAPAAAGWTTVLDARLARATKRARLRCLFGLADRFDENMRHLLVDHHELDLAVNASLKVGAESREAAWVEAHEPTGSDRTQASSSSRPYIGIRLKLTSRGLGNPGSLRSL